MQRCSGLLNRRARGSTVATHHFADVAQQRQQQFRKLPGVFAPRECESLRRPHFCIRGEITITLRFERRVCRWESCRMHQFTGMWLNPNSRGSRLRIWQPWGCKSLHAHHLTATGFSGNSRPRRLKIAEPSGCKSRVADRRVVNREQQTGSTQDRIALGVQVSPRRPIWNVNRTSGPDLFAKQWAPSKGECGASPRHSAIHARVAQRESAALYPASH